MHGQDTSIVPEVPHKSVIVRREQRAAAHALKEVAKDSIRDGVPVEGAGAATELVDDDEGVFGCLSEHHLCFACWSSKHVGQHFKGQGPACISLPFQKVLASRGSTVSYRACKMIIHFSTQPFAPTAPHLNVFHLHHERTQSSADVIVSPQPREDAIDRRQLGQ
jgi:hypothetical protein